MEESTPSSQSTEPPGTVLEVMTLPGEKSQAKVQDAKTFSSLKPLSFKKPVKIAFKFKVSSCSDVFRRRFFRDATLSQWNDWRWQLRNRFLKFSDLSRIVKLSPEERRMMENEPKGLPLAVTPYYASLLDAENAEQPIRRSIIPVPTETMKAAGESEDPLSEDHQSPVADIVHRYPDRVLFLVTSYCATYCRYCTRSRMVGHGMCDHGYSRENWERAIAYIESRPEVRDVLISGGDPLTLPDEKIAWLLGRLKKIAHVEFVRIGTKAPVVLPQRITPALTRILKQHHPWMSIHFTHPDELTAETTEACERLADAGLVLGSQTVLLRGINDRTEILRRLFHGLLKIRVKPYYLYQCDPIAGSAHFRTPVQKGIEIMGSLRGFTSGYALPVFVVDAPGGGGKIPVFPETVIGYEGEDLLLRNYEGNIFRYPDSALPDERVSQKCLLPGISK